MNLGVKKQRADARRRKADRAAEKALTEGYTCAEKYELGTCGVDGCIHVEGTLPEPVEDPIAKGDIDPVHAPTTTMFPPGTIETFTGDSYNFENPQVENIHLADIAHALSNHCRYAGHTKRFYSVGEHSILVKEILRVQGLPEFIQLVGLFHDAHEAYVMDAPRPLKPLLGKAFEEVAAKGDDVIAAWLETVAPVYIHAAAFHDPQIKLADNIALVYERLQLMTAGPEKWEPGYENVPPLPESLGHPHLGGTSPLGVEGAFLRHAHDLGVDD